jgi:hypothetical protein
VPGALGGRFGVSLAFSAGVVWVRCVDCRHRGERAGCRWRSVRTLAGVRCVVCRHRGERAESALRGGVRRPPCSVVGVVDQSDADRRQCRPPQQLTANSRLADPNLCTAAINARSARWACLRTHTCRKEAHPLAAIGSRLTWARVRTRDVRKQAHPPRGDGGRRADAARCRPRSISSMPTHHAARPDQRLR